MMLKYLNVVVQLADKRVLLYRKHHGGWPQWSVTHEKYLNNEESPLIEANKILYNVFGIDPVNYSDDFAIVKQISPIVIMPNRQLNPYIVKMQTLLSFRGEVEDEYRAFRWDDIIDMIMHDLAGTSTSLNPTFTPTACYAVRGLTNKKVME